MARSNEPATRPNLSTDGARSLGVTAVDPVPIFRDGLYSLVHHTPGLHWTGSATTHNAALQLCEKLKPDVVVLDSALDPNCHLTRLLSDGHPALVIVLLVRESNRTPQYLTTAIAAGAHAAMPRATDARRLAEAIRRAHTEQRYLDSSLAALIAGPKRRAGDQPWGPMPLSRREYQVLQLVAEGLENLEIAKILFLSVETVRTHVKSVLRKLSARDRTHAVTIAFRGGILIPQPGDAHPASPEPRGAAPPNPVID